MNHQANSTVKPYQSGESYDICRKDIPVNDGPGEKGVLIIVHPGEDLSISK